MCVYTVQRDATFVVGGEPIVSLCIVDTEPRKLSSRDQEILAALAGLVEREVALAGELGRAAQLVESSVSYARNRQHQDDVTVLALQRN